MTTLGSVLLIPEVNYWLEDKTGLSLDVLNLRLSSIPEVTEDGPSRVLPLAYLEAEEREAQLQAIASEQERSLDRNRARYLLASDLIRKYEVGLALRTLAR